jgi:hypothetical protein
MLKYLAVLIVFLGFAFIIARHDEYSALKGARPAADQHNPAITGKTDENHPQEHPQYSYWDSPSGHIFHNAFRWPEGTTVWAIILTLMAIAEQTSATRRAAEDTRNSVKAQQESLRPRLAIGFTETTINATPYSEMVTGGRLVFTIDLINTGGIPAYGVIPETWIEYLPRPFRFTTNALYNKGEPITVHPTNPTHYRVPFNRSLAPNEIVACRNAVATICIRIRLSYQAFGKEAHTEEAYSTEPSGMGGISAYSDSN